VLLILPVNNRDVLSPGDLIADQPRSSRSVTRADTLTHRRVCIFIKV